MTRTKILFLAASPTDHQHLSSTAEFTGIQRVVDRTRFELEPGFEQRATELFKQLATYQPQILHFSGHASEAGELLFQRDDGSAYPASPEAIARVFALSPRVQCVVLAACYSKLQAEVMREHVEVVIGMHGALSDIQALEFSIGFYEGLSNQRSVGDAFELGKARMRLTGSGGEDELLILASERGKQLVFSASSVLSPDPLAVSLDTRRDLELLKLVLTDEGHESPRGLGWRRARLLRRQLDALQVLAEYNPGLLERHAERLRVHPASELREWWAARMRRAAFDEVQARSARIGLELVALPSGSFMMGSRVRESGRGEHEGPRHKVELASFLLACTPVTNAQFTRFLHSNADIVPPTYWTDPRFNQPQQPVVGVSWDDAQAYCEWAGLQLPTEAQWEFACRAGGEARFSSGEDEAELARIGWYRGNSRHALQPVGVKPGNAFGLKDMHGNVWEWCADPFHAYRGSCARAGDGRRASSTSSIYKVVRGGCWEYPAELARSAFRGRKLPDARGHALGFRPAWNYSST